MLCWQDLHPKIFALSNGLLCKTLRLSNCAADEQYLSQQTLDYYHPYLVITSVIFAPLNLNKLLQVAFVITKS
jgi:hypothetical protein